MLQSGVDMRSTKRLQMPDWGESLDIGEVENLQNGDISMVLEDEEGKEEMTRKEDGILRIWICHLILTHQRLLPMPALLFLLPQNPGMPVSQIWVQKSSLAAEHAAAGNFDTAMRLLSRQLGIKNFSPLKQLFADLHMGSHTYLRAFSSHQLSLWQSKEGGLEEKLKTAYRATTSGKFSDALRLFLSILHTIPLIVVESRREVDEVKELIVIVKEYVLGLQMEVKRKESKDNPVRQQEASNLSSAANFARRLLETNPTNESQAKTARQVLQAAEKNMRNATELNYDFRNPFVVCGATYVPIYRGQKDVTCPYCTTHFVPSHQGQLCTVCDLAVVGADASGLLCSPSQVR
ncbi:hypothetical protein KY290_026265 [Solanum tuberosum]|uniref:Coatomer alpha subunit C-terminal domain-containing protein n=1 Tax=Solanum tuberosum TaxID=4113 RepID=A0ABQ7UZ10_SOLTU|nr:hypothetical protein KY290_026265 [Solanum tuberosum]